LTTDQQQKAEQLVADSLKDNPDIFNLPESKRSIDDLSTSPKTGHIEWTLRHCTKQSEKAYKMYIGRLEQKLVVDKEIAKRKLSDAKSELKKQENLYAKYQNLQLISLADYNKHHKGKLEFHQKFINVQTSLLLLCKQM